MGPQGEAKRIKPLKEITNKLVAQPFNLKPSWAGTKNTLKKSKFNLREKLYLIRQTEPENEPFLFTQQSRPTTPH